MTEIKTIQTEVKEFVAKLPYWQRPLLFHSINSAGARHEVVQSSYMHLLAETKLSKDPLEQPTIDLPDFFGTSDGSAEFKNLRLKEVKDIENVNALRPKQRLTFGPNLTVIFGCNGSGKSGFARLLNTAFYSRGDRTILQNIFAAKTNDPPKATFVFQDGTEQPNEIGFPQGKTAPEFRNFAVFDSKSVLVHLNERNEVYVPPRVVDIFEKLATLVSEVTVLIDGEIQKRTKPSTLSAFFEGVSPIKAAIDGLKASTDLEAVKKLSEFKPEEIERGKQLEIEIAKLKVQDVDARKKELGGIKDVISSMKKNIESIESHFSNHPVTHYKNVIETHQRLKKDAEAVGAKQFEDTRFQSIGSPTWKTFLNSAQSYAQTQVDDHGHTYPRQGDSCILCRQALTSEAVTLIERYWQYLSGEAETKVKTSGQTLQSETRTLGALTLQKLISDSSASKWIAVADPILSNELISFIDSRISEIEKLSKALETASWSEFVLVKALDFTRLTTLEQRLDKEIADLNATKLKEEENKLQAELTVLKHREKLAEYYTQIETYVLNQRWLDLARETRRKITTKAITDLQKKLHDELLNKKYKLLFHQECQELKAPYQINLEQKGVSGKTLRQLSVEGFQPGQVLSEGEQRAIALADFFTEIEISGIRAGIIFDDPVNSLDHERKETIARKLVRASKTRQVVVFTHDLGFIYDLKNEASKLSGVDFTFHWVERLLQETGVVSLGTNKSLEKEHLEPTKAELKHKEAVAASDAGDRERLVTEGMALLRSSYEAFIIMELFNGTVVRFDRQIKFANLKEVHAPRDHAVAVYSKYSYVSGFIPGHLHSDEYTGTQPTVQVLETEIAAYKELRQKCRSERKLAMASDLG